MAWLPNRADAFLSRCRCEQHDLVFRQPLPITHSQPIHRCTVEESNYHESQVQTNLSVGPRRHLDRCHGGYPSDGWLVSIRLQAERRLLPATSCLCSRLPARTELLRSRAKLLW